MNMPHNVAEMGVRASQIEESTSALDVRANALVEGLEKLSARLISIRRETPTMDASQKAQGPEEYLVPHADRLRGIARVLDRAAFILSELHNTIEL